MPLRVHYKKRPVFSEPEVPVRPDSSQVKHSLLSVVSRLWIPLLVFIIPLVYYWPVLASGFVSDDFFYHATFTWSFNEFVEKIMQIRGGELHFPFFRPVVITSFRIDYWIWGADPAGFHLTNLVIHSLNSLLLFYFAGNLGLGRFGAAACSLFYGLYPASPEAVTWISGRFDLMAMTFTMIALLSWCASRLRNDVRWMIPSAVAFGLAILSKEHAAAGLMFLPLLDWILNLRTRKEWNHGVGWNWQWYVVFFAIVLSVIAFRFWLYQDLGGYTDEHGRSAFLSVPGTDIWNHLVRGDLWMLLTPVSRILWPEWNPAYQIAIITSGVFLGLLLVETILQAIFVDYKTDISPLVLIGSFILWILTFLLPVATLDGAKTSLDYTRFLYIPVAGLSLWIGLVSDMGWNYSENLRRLSVIILAIILFISGTILISHNKTWIEAAEYANRIHSVMETHSAFIPDNSNLYVVNYPWLWKGAHCAPIDYGGYLEYRYDIKGTNTHIVFLDPEEVDDWWFEGSQNWDRPGIGFEWNRSDNTIRYLGRFEPEQLSDEFLLEFLGREITQTTTPDGRAEVEVLPEPPE